MSEYDEDGQDDLVHESYRSKASPPPPMRRVSTVVSPLRQVQGRLDTVIG